jgi:preprotein translocase subunit SecE
MLGVRVPPGLPVLIEWVIPMATETLVERSSFLEKLRIRQIQQFFVEVRSEMKKVSWPGRKEVYGTTIVVVCAVFFFGIYLGLVDLVLRLGVDRIFKFFR